MLGKLYFGKRGCPNPRIPMNFCSMNAQSESNEVHISKLETQLRLVLRWGLKNPSVLMCIWNRSNVLEDKHVVIVLTKKRKLALIKKSPFFNGNAGGNPHRGYISGSFWQLIKTIGSASLQSFFQGLYLQIWKLTANGYIPFNLRGYIFDKTRRSHKIKKVNIFYFIQWKWIAPGKQIVKKWCHCRRTLEQQHHCISIRDCFTKIHPTEVPEAVLWILWFNEVQQR